MSRFRKATRCPQCDNLIIESGVSLDLTAPEGVVDFSLFADTVFHCDDCNINICIGDMYSMCAVEECEEESK